MVLICCTSFANDPFIAEVPNAGFELGIYYIWDYDRTIKQNSYDKNLCCKLTWTRYVYAVLKGEGLLSRELIV